MAKRFQISYAAIVSIVAIVSVSVMLNGNSPIHPTKSPLTSITGNYLLGNKDRCLSGDYDSCVREIRLACKGKKNRESCFICVNDLTKKYLRDNINVKTKLFIDFCKRKTKGGCYGFKDDASNNYVACLSCVGKKYNINIMYDLYSLSYDTTRERFIDEVNVCPVNEPRKGIASCSGYNSVKASFKYFEDCAACFRSSDPSGMVTGNIPEITIDRCLGKPIKARSLDKYLGYYYK